MCKIERGGVGGGSVNRSLGQTPQTGHQIIIKCK